MMNKDCFADDMDNKMRAVRHIRDSYDDLRLELQELEACEEAKQSILRLEESRMWFEACIRA